MKDLLQLLLELHLLVRDYRKHQDYAAMLPCAANRRMKEAALLRLDRKLKEIDDSPRVASGKEEQGGK